MQIDMPFAGEPVRAESALRGGLLGSGMRDPRAQRRGVSRLWGTHRMTEEVSACAL